MRENRWRKIEEVFNQAVVLPLAERQEFVEQQCGGDDELCSEILILVDGDSEESSFLNEPVFSLGAQILENDFLELLKTGELSYYKLKKLLGRGGMGAVFLAEDTRLGRDVAIKVLPSYIAENADSIRRFRQEARAASNVAHQNIAHIYEFSHLDERYFLAMEYVRGQTLRLFIKTNPVDLSQTLDFIAQIASALQAAHRSHIIHRDIKPENVIVTDEGLIKILDFGLAKFDVSGADKSDESISAAETEPELIMGTVSYMSPEQIRAEFINHQTDIWSLGIVFYEILTGKRPFAGKNRTETITAILNDAPQPPSDFNPEVSTELERMILKMLEKDSARRYQTIEDFLFDLHKIKNNSVSKTKLDVIADNIKKYGAAIVLVLIIFTFVYVGFWFAGDHSSNSPPANTKSQISSIAVMPFVDENPVDDKEYLSDGLTETLIDKLSQIPNLTVKARSSVFKYKGKNYDPQVAGKQLNVQSVLIGRINANGNNLILQFSLIDVQNGNQIWGERFDRQPADLIRVQNEIARDIFNKLRTNMSGADEQKVVKNFTNDIPAYQLYLKGRFYWNKRTAKDIQKSTEYFQQSIELDPNFALAYAGLADSYVLFSGYGIASPRESFPKAKEAAMKALEIDDSLAEAHCALGYTLFNYDWNFAESEKEMKKAIELNPNYATAHHWYGNANLLATGHLEESIAELQRALELNPLSLIVNADLGTNYLFARQPDKAIEQYKKTLEMDENFYYARAYLGRAYLMKGFYSQAIEEFQKAEKLGNDPRITMLLSLTYAAEGKRKNAIIMLNKLQRSSDKSYVSPYYFALIYAGLGDKNKAFEWLDKGLEAREGRMTLIKVDPLLDNLRSDSRFPVLLKKVGLD